MKRHTILVIFSLLLHNVNLQAAEVYADTFLNPDIGNDVYFDKPSIETFNEKILNASLTSTQLCRWSLDKFFLPGQALMACKLWDVNPTTCRMKMTDFQSVQCNRCCLFTGATCALGAGALACSACGCPGAATVAGTGAKICAAGACIAPQIPFQFSFESPTGNSKDE